MSAADCLMERAAVSFTGGKDCVLAMHLYGSDKQLLTAVPQHEAGLRWSQEDSQAACRRFSLLVTFAPPDAQFKAHPLDVIKAQARALQLPHELCEVDPEHPLESYKQHLHQLHQQHGITKLITGDILDVAGGFMQKAAEGTGIQLVTPLWQQPRCLLLQSVLDLGIRAVISCVNVTKYRCQQHDAVTQSCPASQPSCNGDAQMLRQQAAVANTTPVAVASETDDHPEVQHLMDAAADSKPCLAFDVSLTLLGQTIDRELIEGPLTTAEKLFGCDKCGEFGEYHTLVTAAPMFQRALDLRMSKLAKCCRGVFEYIIWNVEGTGDADQDASS